MNRINPIITIDGPSGSGKGTLCLMLSKILKWNILDSGLLYRFLAMQALFNHIHYNNEKDLVVLANQLNTHFVTNSKKLIVYLKEKNFEKIIYDENVATIASNIAILPRVRKTLNKIQRSFVKPPGLIADGRDMGTVVFPNAILKIFLYASIEVRTNRRIKQLKKNCSHFFHIYSTIKNRDHRDQYRVESPLIPAQDALLIDSTNLSINDTVSVILIRLKKIFSNFYYF